jgi:hypothetical protein
LEEDDKADAAKHKRTMQSKKCKRAAKVVTDQTLGPALMEDVSE